MGQAQRGSASGSDSLSHLDSSSHETQLGKLWKHTKPHGTEVWRDKGIGSLAKSLWDFGMWWQVYDVQSDTQIPRQSQT